MNVLKFVLKFHDKSKLHRKHLVPLEKITFSTSKFRTKMLVLLARKCLMVHTFFGKVLSKQLAQLMFVYTKRFCVQNVCCMIPMMSMERWVGQTALALRYLEIKQVPHENAFSARVHT